MTATDWIERHKGSVRCGMPMDRFELCAAEIIIRQFALIHELGTKYQRLQELCTRRATKEEMRAVLDAVGVLEAGEG